MTAEKSDLETILARYSNDPLFIDGDSLGVDSRAMDGDTLLHRVVLKGDVEGVEVLIENGADVNAVGEMGDTPLHHAVIENSPRLVDALMRLGANPRIKNEFGMDAIEWAKDCGHHELVQILSA